MKVPKSSTRGCQGGKQTQTHVHISIHTTHRHFSKPSLETFSFHQGLTGFVRDSAPAPHLSQAPKWTGDSAAWREMPHYAGNGRRAAGAETRGGRAKKSAHPSPTRLCKARSIATLLPFPCLLYTVSVELSPQWPCCFETRFVAVQPNPVSITHRLKDMMSATF